MDKEFFNGMNLSEDISEEDFQFIVDGWEKVKDIISKEEFIDKFNEIKADNQDVSFFNDKDFLSMVVDPLTTERAEPIIDDSEVLFKKINEFEDGETYSIYGRIMDILDVRTFSKEDHDGRVCNAFIADDTGRIKLVFWNDIIDKLEGVNEGDIVSITNVKCKNGFRDNLELQLTSSSELNVLTEEDEDYPDVSNYPLVGVIKKINEIGENDSVSLVARVKKIGEINTFTVNDGSERSNANVTLTDETGEINLTVWSEHFDSLEEFNEGDVLKLEKVSTRKNNFNGIIELSFSSSTTFKVLDEGDEDYPNVEGFPTYEEVTSRNYDKIADLSFGNIDTVVGRVMSISNPKIFRSSRGKEGKLCKVEVADDSGSITVTFWTENIKHLKHMVEGDIVKFTNLDCKKGYNTEKDLSLRPRSLVRVIDMDDEDYPDDIENFPTYEETFTDINEIVPDTTVSIIGRLIRVPAPHNYESNGKKGKVTSLEIQDKTGKISYTLWNKDVNLIDSLELKEGDIVKILNEPSRERNGEISLSHWDGRILKAEGDYDIPEYEENIIKIANAQEINDVSLIGVITKIQDTIDFTRADGTTGHVKSIEISDETGSIRVTLWGDDTKLSFTKGDIIKIIGGNIEYDDYTTSGYRVNTNWNTEFKLDPELDDETISNLKGIASRLGPIPISQIQELETDGDEVDIIGRLVTLFDSRSFPRDDGTEGLVSSGIIADGSGNTRISFWDDKAKMDYVIGKAYQNENARTRLGMQFVELNVGKTTRVMELSDADAPDLPSFEDLEETVFSLRKISDLDDDDDRIKVIARLIEIEDTREFARQDGSKGVFRKMSVGDDDGSIDVTLWDKKTDIKYSVGDAIKIQNPRVNYNDRTSALELSINNTTNILTPDYNEMSDLPSFEELQNREYPLKDIASLELEDRKVRINATLVDPYMGSKNLIPKCPICQHTLEDDEEECSECGNIVDEPNYLLMLPAKLVDETGEIDVVFYNELVEKLIGMKQDDVVAQYEEDGDLGFLEFKIADLNGVSLELIGGISYSSFNDEISFRPKKILSE